MSAPRRLLDDPSAPEGLRDDLRVAAEAEPRYDAERGLLALQAAVATLGHGAPLAEGVRQAASGAPQASAASQAAATGTVGGVGGALGAASAGKLTLVAVATALGLAGTLAWMSSGPEAPAAQPAPAARAVPAAVAPAADRDPDPGRDRDPDPGPVVGPTGAHAAEAVASPPVRVHHAAPVDPDLALRREIDHLARVRALLEQDPKAAYELAQAGNRTLSSMFRQEREGLSVLALDAAGEHARARRLARQFLSRHPDSPLHERIAELLAPAAEPR